MTSSLTHRLGRLEAQSGAARRQRVREMVLRIAVDAGIDAALRRTEAAFASVFGAGGMPEHLGRHDLERLVVAAGLSPAEVDRFTKRVAAQMGDRSA